MLYFVQNSLLPLLCRDHSPLRGRGVIVLLLPLWIGKSATFRRICQSSGANVLDRRQVRTCFATVCPDYERRDRRTGKKAAAAWVAAKLLLMIGARGNIHTETFRAFTEEEYRIPYSISSMKYSLPLPSGKIYQGWKESPIVPVHQYI